MKTVTLGFAVLATALASRPALAQCGPDDPTYISVSAAPGSIFTNGWTEITVQFGPTPSCMFGGPPALGNVTFSAGGVTLGTAEAVELIEFSGIGTATLSVNGSQLALGDNTVIATYANLSGSVVVTVAPPTPGVIFTASSATNSNVCLLSWNAPGYSQLEITPDSATGTPLTGILGSSGMFQGKCPKQLLINGVPKQFFLLDLTSNAAIASTTEYGAPGPASAPGPMLTSLTPGTIPAGSRAATLEVNGSNFSTASAVTWNNASLATQFQSVTLLQATVPASMLINAGTAQVAVADGGQVSTAVPLTIGPAGCDVSFTANPNPLISPTGIGVTTLSWHAPCYDQLKITVVSPTGTPLTGGVGSSGTAQTGPWVTDGLQFFLMDTTTNTAIASLAMRVCTSACQPVLTSLAPSTVPMGVSDATLQTAGFNLDDASVVTWNNAPLQTQYLGPMLLKATVPADLLAFPATGSVAVATGSQVSTALPFQVSCPNAAATLTANPNPILSSTVVGVTTLSWSGPCYNQLEIRVGSANGQQFTGQNGPSGSAQTGDWVSNGLQFFLVNLATGASLASVTVSVVDLSRPPVLTSISPLGAEVGYSGLTLQMSGSNFSPSSVVTWNGMNLATQFQNVTSLNATVPDSLLKILGTVEIGVSTNGLASASLLFAVGNTAFLDDKGMNNYHGFIACTPSVTTTAFLETDLAANVWFEVDGAIVGDVAQAQWFGPNGSLFATMRSPLDLAGSGCSGFSLPLAGYPAAFMPGNWQVVVTWNGHPFSTLPFTIEPGAIESYDGQWIGFTSDSQPFSMTVANNYITSYEYRVSGQDCPSGVSVSSGPSTSIPIVGNSFSSIELSGTFAYPTWAKGSQNTANIPGCSASGTMTWVAAKQ